MPANPNLLPVSAITDADKKVEHDIYWAGERGIGIPGEIAARHRLAAEQSVRETWQAGTGAAIDTLASELAIRQQAMAALVAMLEGMKVKPTFARDRRRNAVIDEAIAKAKALGEGRAGS